MADEPPVEVTRVGAARRGDRASKLDGWRAAAEAYRASPEGQAETARRAADEAELEAWLAATPEMEVTSHGGIFPEQWDGRVDGHSFYFREKRDHWRIELDLEPSGHFYKVWIGGDLEDESSFERREAQVGRVIASGDTDTDGYGDRPVERARFIYRTIAGHLVRQTCTVHQTDDLEPLYGNPPNYCPACGVPMYADRPRGWSTP